MGFHLEVCKIEVSVSISMVLWEHRLVIVPHVDHSGSPAARARVTGAAWDWPTKLEPHAVSSVWDAFANWKLKKQQQKPQIVFIGFFLFVCLFWGEAGRETKAIPSFASAKKCCRKEGLSFWPSHGQHSMSDCGRMFSVSPEKKNVHL